VQRNAQNLRVQLAPIAGPDGKALELPRVFRAADVQQLNGGLRGQVLRAAPDEKAQLQQRVAELEKRVKELEAELARAKAASSLGRPEGSAVRSWLRGFWSRVPASRFTGVSPWSELGSCTR
jgi:hypothetical protein